MNQRTVTIVDRLPQALNKEPVLRQITLLWEGRSEPEKANCIVNGKFMSVDFWQRGSESETYEQLLEEAENNRLNPGLRTLRDQLRRMISQKTEPKGDHHA